MSNQRPSAHQQLASYYGWAADDDRTLRQLAEQVAALTHQGASVLYAAWFRQAHALASQQAPDGLARGREVSRHMGVLAHAALAAAQAQQR